MMRMITLLAMVMILAAPGARGQEGAASLLKNGSFEGGARYWFNLKEATIVRGDAAQGEYALRISKAYIQSAAFELEPGQAVTISFAARAEGEAETTIGWQCTPCSREAGQKYKQTWGLKNAHPVKISSTWKRYAFTFTPTAAQTGLWPRPTYMLQLGDGSKPWLLDAVSVAYGAGAEAYVPRRPVEVLIDYPGLKGYTDPGANILEKGAMVTLTGAAANPGAQSRELTLRWQLFDYEGTRPVSEAVEKQVMVAPGKVVSGAIMTRAQFLKASELATGGLLLGFRCLGETGAKLEIPEKLALKKWEFLELPAMPGKRKGVLLVTASNGAFGISRTIGNTRDLAQAEAAVKGMNLLDHEALNGAMAANGVPQSQTAMLDVACWDLHARMLGKGLPHRRVPDGRGHASFTHERSMASGSGLAGDLQTH